MIAIFSRRFPSVQRALLVGGVTVCVVALAATFGVGVSRPGFRDLTPVMILLLVGGGVLLLKPEVGIVLVCGLSNLVYFNLSVFDVQGREITVLHLLAGGLVIAWLLRQVAVERRLEIPRTALNPPLLFLMLVWIVTWIAGYTFWDRRLPTVHRQPLFFVTELGQLLIFISVFWVVADRVRNQTWARGIAVTIIVANAATFIWAALTSNPNDTGMWNMMQMAVALTYAWLTEPSTRPKDRLWLGLAMTIFILGIIPVRRIPIYAATAATILVISFFRSRKAFALLLFLTLMLAMNLIAPLWSIEGSILYRFRLAEAAWSIFVHYPILGVGPTHYRSYAILYHPKGWTTAESGMLLPHNEWLYHLVDTGIVGALAILWVVVSIVRTELGVLRNSQKPFTRVVALGGLGCLAGVIVQSVGGHFPFIPTYNLGHMYLVLFWVVLGLVLATERMEGT